MTHILSPNSKAIADCNLQFKGFFADLLPHQYHTNTRNNAKGQVTLPLLN